MIIVSVIVFIVVTIMAYYIHTVEPLNNRQS